MSLADDVLPDFGSLKFSENLNGWGPVNIPEEFKNMPFQPFSKDMRLGRIADCFGNVYQDSKTKGRYVSPFVGSQYAYYHDEDDSNFQLVTTNRDFKQSNIRQRYRFLSRGRRGSNFGSGYSYVGGRGNYQNLSASGAPLNRKLRIAADRERMMQQNRRWQHWGAGNAGQRRGAQGNWRGNVNAWGANHERRQTNKAIRDASVQISDSWNLVEELDFARLSKLSLPNIKPPEDKVNCGELEYYDKSYDRINTRNERPLAQINRVRHIVPTSVDPVIMRLAKDRVGKVYCTDNIAAAIMSCTRSVYPWDITVTRLDSCIFLEERDNDEFNLVTVCETAIEPPNEDPSHINSPQRLALEATYINTNLCQQMLLMGGKRHAFAEPNPFVDDDDEEEDDDDEDETDVEPKSKYKPEIPSVGYRYRLFDLGNDIQLVVRCEVNGVLGPVPEDDEEQSNNPQFVCIRGLNEFDSRYCGGVDWRTKLDTQRGAVLASEIKNNAFKLARWTICGVLAGADQIKLGFVSRVNPRDSSHHTILGTQQFKPQEFAVQLNLNIDNCWGILRCVIDFFMKMPTGKYIMLKDPNKSILRIFSIPTDFDESEESENEEKPNVHKTEA